MIDVDPSTRERADHSVHSAPNAPGSAMAAWLRALAHRPARLNLALQGGGAHGAFTWGVLDALLADPRTRFEALSGASAGAINAALFADGWAKGGRAAARQSLAEFWGALGRQLPNGLVEQRNGEAVGLTPASKLFAHLAAQFAPAQWNPLDLNPLRTLLRQHIDFDYLRAHSPFKLFVGATQANTGRLRIFRSHEITVEVLLASSCLPRVHHPVVIDGEPYWDGAYSANPAISPLFYECRSRDILLVPLSPARRADAPPTREGIEERIAELTFSANLARELALWAQAMDYARGPWWRLGRHDRRLRGARFHLIDATGVPRLHATETKLLAHTPFLEELMQSGRAQATAWLAQDFAQVGRRSSHDLRTWLA